MALAVLAAGIGGVVWSGRLVARAAERLADAREAQAAAHERLGAAIEESSRELAEAWRYSTRVRGKLIVPKPRQRKPDELEPGEVAFGEFCRSEVGVRCTPEERDMVECAYERLYGRDSDQLTFEAATQILRQYRAPWPKDVAVPVGATA